MYYISTDGIEKIGPISLDQLSQYNLTPDTLVWCSGMDNWCHASQVEELTPYLEAQAQPQPQPQPWQQPKPQQHFQAQPWQQPLQEPEPQPLTTSQKVFRAFLFIPTIVTMLFGIGLLIISLICLTSNKINSSLIDDQLYAQKIIHSFVVSLICAVLITTISITIITRLIQGRRYGFTSICFFFLCLFYIVITRLRGVTSFMSGDYQYDHDFYKIKHVFNICADCFILLGAIGLFLAIFSAIPIEKFGEGRRHKALFSETSYFDYTLLGLFLIIVIILIAMAPLLPFVKI